MEPGAARGGDAGNGSLEGHTPGTGTCGARPFASADDTHPAGAAAQASVCACAVSARVESKYHVRPCARGMPQRDKEVLLHGPDPPWDGVAVHGAVLAFTHNRTTKGELAVTCGLA
eukprot:1374393-Prymnesium_polylepis.1